ncbi:hypothetical protein BRY73_18460 [Ochrobactrum sp. P6BS-III]|uniref:LysR family transcriptional regulator n=1 Tax=unclassified Ochrobactrum TaxID=239106 RepID=UPI000991A3BA|nr:DNA-binding transcriptional LysR family regulator [Ochrobactrum sp. P6BSIII]OOL15605.1 hypothetical protein BRY73_18460 [Ochrobactrum sp. P6BS-III]
MISLRQLHYFVTSAEAGSATGAAEKLNVSQPSISAAIRDLEHDLGQQLFERRQAKGLELTPFGSRKLQEARLLLAGAEDFAVSGKGEGGARLTLGYFSTLGPVCIPGILGHLKQVFPDMRVKLREFDLEGMARALEKGIVDLGITYDVGLPETVTWETMLSYAPHAVVPPDSPLAAKKSVTLAELARYPFILVDLPLSREFLLVPFWQQGLSPNIALRTTSVEMVRGMVANGLGVSLLFTRPGHDFSHDGRKVVCLPIEDETLRQRLVLAYPSGGPATLTAQEAMPVIRDCFAARSFQAGPDSSD